MRPSRIASQLKEYLDTAEEAVTAFLRPGISRQDALITDKLEKYQQSQRRLDDSWKQLIGLHSTAGPDLERSTATAWIRPYLDEDLLPRLARLLAQASTHAAFVQSAATPQSVRTGVYGSVHAAVLCATPSFTLLDRLTRMMGLIGEGFTPGQDRFLETARVRLLEPGIIHPVAGAIRSMTSLAVYATSRGGRQALASCNIEGGRKSALEACTCAMHAAALYTSLMAAFFTADAPGSTQSGGSTLAEAPGRRIGVFYGSQLLAAAAAAVVDHPAAPDRDFTLRHLHSSARMVVEAIGISSVLCRNLTGTAGAQAAALARCVAEALVHPDVRRLQEAALERLLLHAGMEDAVGFVSGSSGPAGWWLLREEAEQGRLCGVDAAGSGSGTRAEHTAGWLEDLHCYTAFGSVGVWGDLQLMRLASGGAAPAGSTRPAQPGAAAGQGADRPAAPPSPLRVFQLAARTAEALYRLCKGRGMGGAYAPVPEWECIRSSEMLAACFDFTYEASILSTSEARECMPYWLESAAWGLAIAAEAEEANAAGELPQLTAGSMLVKAASEDDLTGLLMTLVAALDALIRNPSCGVGTLSDAVRADIARRLHRAGAAASLDRVVRLAFTAHDRGTPAARALAKAPEVAALANGWSVIPFLCPSAPAPPPQEEPRPGRRQREQPAAAGGGGGSVAGSDPWDQLGLLITSSKRAAPFTLALEATPLACMSREQRQQLVASVQPASDVVWLLLQAVGEMEPELRRRMAAARRDAPAAAPATAAGSSGGSTASSQPPPAWDAADAGCVCEAQEAAALAVRSACRLLAPSANAVACFAQFDGMAVIRTLSQTTIALDQLLKCSQLPIGLPAAQLLACQPHRLIMAACKLAAMRVEPARLLHNVASAAASCVVSLAARRHVSEHVRNLLTPAPAQRRRQGHGSGAAADSGGGGGAQAGGGGGVLQPAPALRGCLVQPLRALLPRLLEMRSPHAGCLLALMRAAAEAPSADAHGGSHRMAASLLALLDGPLGNVAPGSQDVAVLPDGTRMSELVAEARRQPDSAFGAVDPAAELPPPMEGLASPALALRWVRMCGNPGCTNFGRAAEADLRPKQCAGCKAVRYCGSACQTAHWRGAHKAECAQLAGRAVAAGSG